MIDAATAISGVVRVRPRWRRAIRFPWILMRYRRIGMSWRMAFHWTVWVISYGAFIGER